MKIKSDKEMWVYIGYKEKIAERFKRAKPKDLTASQFQEALLDKWIKK